MIKLELKNDGLGGKVFVGYGKKEDFKCSDCGKEISEGFICENNSNLVLCPECQDNFKMQTCKHNKHKEHRHIKFIGGNNAQ